MGKENDAMLEFLRDDRRFADLFNGGLFAGESVVDAAELQEAGETYIRFEENFAAGHAMDKKKKRRKSGKQTTVRTRDIKKRLGAGAELRILALEEQSHIDYTMPLRCMDYDTLEYLRQAKAVRQENKTAGQYDSVDERLCQYRKTDRLSPVYTVCLYHGEKPWDGPRSLRDMLDVGSQQDGDPWVRLFSDYRMNLICVNELDNLDVFTSGLKELFAIMSYRNDKQGMNAFLEEHEEYQTIDEDTADAIGAVMGVKDFMKNKEKFKNGEGYNMCTAIREMWEDGRSEGIALGRSEGRSEGRTEGITLSAAIFRAVNSGITNNEQIAHQCECSSEQVAEIRSVFGL